MAWKTVTRSIIKIASAPACAFSKSLNQIKEIYKPPTKNNSKYWLFLHSYFNKIRPNLVCQVLVGRLMEVTTINNVKTLVGTARWSLNRGLISHLFLQLFRGIDYWPPNEGWLLNRWPLNEVQLYTEWVKGLRGNPTWWVTSTIAERVPCDVKDHT